MGLASKTDIINSKQISVRRLTKSKETIIVGYKKGKENGFMKAKTIRKLTITNCFGKR